MTDGVVVRRAVAGDVAALVALRVEMFRAMGVEADDAAWRDAAARWFAERLDDVGHGIVVVEEGGRVVACAVGSVRDSAPSPTVPEGRDVLVHTVCTFPEARGRGHGRRAFEAVMAWARSTGIGRAELMATADGRPMYERAGFAATEFPAMRAHL